MFEMVPMCPKYKLRSYRVNGLLRINTQASETTVFSSKPGKEKADYGLSVPGAAELNNTKEGFIF